MYNPCWECFNRYGHSYDENCKCQYAEILNLLESYGGIDSIAKVMKGDAIPIVLIDKEHIDNTYTFVCAVKDGLI